MRIVKAYPPNIVEIEQCFDLTGKTPVFCYGQVLFNPHGCPVDQYLLAHEVTHSAQQGSNVIDWWSLYLKDNAFRLLQEVEAYHAQYLMFSQTQKDRNKVAWYLNRMAIDLSSAMYGNLCTLQKAREYIKTGKI